MTVLPLATKISYQLGWPLRVIGIAGSVALLLFIFELVRRRQLKEEYTVLWVLTGLALLLLAAWEGLLRKIAEAIGASSEASMLYFFGLIFVVFLLLHFSVRVSRLERRVLSMVQEIALLGTSRPSNGAAPAAALSSAHAPGEARVAEDGHAADNAQASQAAGQAQTGPQAQVEAGAAPGSVAVAVPEGAGTDAHGSSIPEPGASRQAHA